ncbi:MAG: hypothetical protein NTV86_04155, partial [Planctomycetota bacterium]|nr:hypothetical protein [Planctomycetota bacterium]
MKTAHVLKAAVIVFLVAAWPGVSSASTDISDPLNLLQGKAISTNCTFQDGGIWKVVDGYGDYSHLGVDNWSWKADNAQAITGLDGSRIATIRVWSDPFTPAAPRVDGEPWYAHVRGISGFAFKSSTTDWAGDPLGGYYETDLGDYALPLAETTGVLPAGWTSVGANDDPPWLFYYDITVNVPVGTKSLWFHMDAPSSTGAQLAQDLHEIQAFAAGAPTWPDYLAGDFNKDGEVGPEDFGILKDNFGLDGLPWGLHESWTLGDANDDGEIGPEDFGLLKDNFGLDGGPTGT